MNTERTPNWDKWRLIPDVHVWQGVALSLGIDPDKVKHNKDGWMAGPHRRLFNESKEFEDRIDIALANVGNNRFLQVTGGPWEPAEDRMVALAALAAWVRSIEAWESPMELAALANNFNQTLTSSEPATRPGYSKLLVTMTQAATTFWVNADPGDSSTHPTNVKVAKWLEDRGFSPTLAAKAATILRPEWAPTGRKREK